MLVGATLGNVLRPLKASLVHRLNRGRKESLDEAVGLLLFYRVVIKFFRLVCSE